MALVAAALLTWALLEVGAFLLFDRVAGQPLDFERLAAARDARLAQLHALLDGAGTADLPVVPHPYLGYVGRPGGPHPHLVGATQAPRFNEYGLIGSDAAPYPSRRLPGTLVVGILGGSVAEIFANTQEQGLEQQLRRVEPRFDRRVIMVNLALGGFKQPQQLFHLEYALLLGFEFDVVVNLDGFNDLVFAVENAERGVHPVYPSAYHMATLLQLETRGVLDPATVEALHDYYGAHRRERLVLELVAGGPLRWSPFANLFALTWSRRQALRAGEIRFESTRELGRALPAELRGPGGPWPHGSQQLAARAWAEASRMLAAICARAGVGYVHLLQPNQYVEGSKVLGDEEARIAVVPDHPWGRIVREGYPFLRAEGRRLREDGVPFYDLTLIFKDQPAATYADECCHLSPLGSLVLSAHLAAILKRELGESLVTRPDEER